MPRHPQIEKYLDGRMTRSEMVSVQCNGCGAQLHIRSGNREYKAQLAAGHTVTIYCIPCEEQRHKEGRLVPISGIGVPRCRTCGAVVELGTHGGVVYSDCPNRCKEGWYYATVEGQGTRISDPPGVLDAAIGLLEILDELTDTEGN